MRPPILWILTLCAVLPACGASPTGVEIDPDQEPQVPLQLTGQVRLNGIPREADLVLRYSNSGVEGCLPSMGGCYGHWSVDQVVGEAAAGADGRYRLTPDETIHCASPYHSLTARLTDPALGDVGVGGALEGRCGAIEVDAEGWYSHVSGRVTVDGLPIGGATVQVFHGNGASTTASSTAEESLGAYRLTTYGPFPHATYCDYAREGAYLQVTLPDGRTSAPLALSEFESEDCPRRPVFDIDVDFSTADG